MPLGWGAALSMQLGGGPSDIELVWQALRDAVGKGGAGPIDGIEDLWRQSKARAIAASAAAQDRAALQALPSRATDALPAYERLLGIVPPADATETERRAEATRRFTLDQRATGGRLEAELRRIEPTTVLLEVDPDTTIVAQFGWAFDWRPYTGFYGSNNATNFPNYSTEYLVTAQVTVPDGATINALNLIRLRETLNTVLPAWVDFAVVQVGSAGGGFLLDGGPDGTSLLDLTAFTS